MGQRRGRLVILAATCGLLFSIEMAQGGDCGCARPAPVVISEPDCGCAAAAACCGGGSGLAQIAGVYGQQGLYAGYPYSQNFLSGYEGLPNMDGGGVHYRYPYHSYRRPWFHPGPPSTNISIVW